MSIISQAILDAMGISDNIKDDHSKDHPDTFYVTGFINGKQYLLSKTTQKFVEFEKNRFWAAEIIDIKNGKIMIDVLSYEDFNDVSSNKTIFVTSTKFGSEGNVTDPFPKGKYPEVDKKGYVYLHGALQSAMGAIGGWDIPQFFNYFPTKEGVYEVQILLPDTGAPGLFFYWNSSNIKDADSRYWHGLVVFSGDTVSVEFAKQKYAERSQRL